QARGRDSRAVGGELLMLMLVTVKRTLAVDKDMRKGGWSTNRAGNTELGGKDLGIVGVGSVGRRVAKFAGALGMRVIGYDKYVPDDELRRRGAAALQSLEEHPPQVDVAPT